MTAGQSREASRLAHEARQARAVAESASRVALHATVTAIDAGRAAGWSWQRIGDELALSPSAVRGYYERNRRLTHGGDI